jgi:FkbM family methyltransferase
MTTEQLLHETIDEARARECSAFELLAAQTKGRIVLVGAGILGRKALGALRREGVEPEGFADNDPFLAGAGVDGIPVLPLANAVAQWGLDALYVVTIFRPLDGEGMKERLQCLETLGCRRTSSFLPLAWRYHGLLPHFAADLPSKLLEHSDQIRHVAALWSDEKSCEIFRQQLGWRLRGDFTSIAKPAEDQYFPKDLIVMHQNERVVDGGAFDGDTLCCMPGGFAKAWAFEPDPFNAAKLSSRVDNRVTVYRTALGKSLARSAFRALGSTASCRGSDGNIEVEVNRLDDVLAFESPTFLKLDVEGDELAALEGGRAMLSRAQPTVAVCLYHRPADLWEIPLFLHEVLPKHRLHLRSHDYDGFELVAYAVPSERRC